MLGQCTIKLETEFYVLEPIFGLKIVYQNKFFFVNFFFGMYFFDHQFLSNCPEYQFQLGENSSVRDFKFSIIDLVMVNYAKSIKNHPLTQEVLVRPV